MSIKSGVIAAQRQGIATGSAFLGPKGGKKYVNSKGHVVYGVPPIAGKLANVIGKNPGGFTWRPDKGHPSSGIMVGEHTDRNLHLVIDISQVKSKAEVRAKVRDWLRNVGHHVLRDPELFFGGWTSSKDKKLYLDVSRRYDEGHEGQAVAMGRHNNQQAVFHIGRGQEIDTGGTG